MSSTSIVGHIESLTPPYMLLGQIQSDVRVRYDVIRVTDLERLDEARSIGRLLLQYFPVRYNQEALNEVRIIKLDIDEHFRLQGIGKSIVQLLPELPSPRAYLSVPIDYVSSEPRGVPEIDAQFDEFWEKLNDEQVVKTVKGNRHLLIRDLHG